LALRDLLMNIYYIDWLLIGQNNWNSANADLPSASIDRRNFRAGKGFDRFTSNGFLPMAVTSKAVFHTPFSSLAILDEVIGE